jgi:hypothetical protein
VNERKKSFRWNAGEVAATAIVCVLSLTLTVTALSMWHDPYTPDPPAGREELSSIEKVQPSQAVDIDVSPVSPGVEVLDDVSDPLGRADVTYTVESVPTPVIEAVPATVTEQPVQKETFPADPVKTMDDEFVWWQPVEGYTVYEDGSWVNDSTLETGCMEGYGCDDTGKYIAYPTEPHEEGQVCWGNLVQQWTCLADPTTFNKEVTP